MTTPTSEDPFPPLAETVQSDPVQPFDDQVTFQIVKPFGLAQLIDEITTALKREINVAQLGPDDQFGPISETNPVTLAVSPSSVNQSKVQQAIDAHQPVEGYDVPAHEKAFSELRQRVLDEPDAELSAEDIAVAIRGLLLRDSQREAMLG